MNRPLIVLLRVLLFAEAALILGVAVWLLIELVTAPAESFTSAIALFVLALAATAFVTAIAVGALRGAPWIRGAAFTWQILQIAVAVGCFQGLYARADIGWALLVPSVVVIVLLLTPSVRAGFARPDEQNQPDPVS